MKFVDITGQRFGRLTALCVDRREATTYGARIIWRCRCDCGKAHAVMAMALTSKRGTRSCGCVKVARFASHGMSRTREYRAWADMVQRCTNPNHRRYADWGGRGISICGRWMSFENFIADMGMRPTPDHSIDRFPNNDGDYEPGNCRWATRSEQQRNKRNSKCA